MTINSNVNSAISSFSDPRWSWHNGEPPSWSVDAGTGQLKVSPAAGPDYWSKTFYGPNVLVKSDAPSLVATVPTGKEVTLTTAFTLHPRAQFDQAGIMVLVEESEAEHDGQEATSTAAWVKAGVEFTDGHPCLSCVVTNDGYSDWSTQRVVFDDNVGETSIARVGDIKKCKENVAEKKSAGAVGNAVSIRIRVTKHLPGPEQGQCITMEACPYLSGDTPESPGDWYQVRIASLRGKSSQSRWKMGVFSISPVAQTGSRVEFHHVLLGPKIPPVHDAVV